MPGPEIARVEEIETVATDLVDAEWKPVRHHFGITGFGTNAYLARASGDVLIEDHSELRTGFEELYVVLRGQVEFTLEAEPGRDERVHLEAGTLVFVPPGCGRAARAATDDAVVLAVGGVPTKAFSISEWETMRLPPSPTFGDT